ncbi:hypothetical protein ACJMK2_023684 [Sinanodonta woodiana]|uniref:YHYH domain-containing protein n=1 Tax=Sinanodonta woodiana TaxID=1069815 RepID=A0ABD3T5Z4_SINWO
MSICQSWTVSAVSLISSLLVWISTVNTAYLTELEQNTLKEKGITLEEYSDDYWLLKSNGIPEHATGVFPNENNPNTISKQNYEYLIPKNPLRLDKDDNSSNDYECLNMGVTAFASNGVPMFNPYSAEGFNAVEGPCSEVFDDCNAHPDMLGRYHYHQFPNCLYDVSEQYSRLYGVALDGFPIYGPYEVDGTLVDESELDECHGRTAIDGRYEYRITFDFPYILGCYRGKPGSQQSSGLGPQGGSQVSSGIGSVSGQHNGSQMHSGSGSSSGPIGGSQVYSGSGLGSVPQGGSQMYSGSGSGHGPQGSSQVFGSGSRPHEGSQMFSGSGSANGPQGGSPISGSGSGFGPQGGSQNKFGLGSGLPSINTESGSGFGPQGGRQGSNGTGQKFGGSGSGSLGSIGGNQRIPHFRGVSTGESDALAALLRMLKIDGRSYRVRKSLDKHYHSGNKGQLLAGLRELLNQLAAAKRADSSCVKDENWMQQEGVCPLKCENPSLGCD